MILKGYKYRIYPSKGQKSFLERHFGSMRYIYNWALDKKIKYYETHKKTYSTIALIKEITPLKKQDELSWLNDVNSQSLQSELRHLDQAFVNFFRVKKGFPKFKSKHNHNQSFQIPQHYKLDGKKLFIPKLKAGIKIKQHRNFNGEMKTLTISKNCVGQYFATILVETKDNIVKPKKIKEKPTIGIDLGIKDFLVTSNGEKITNPKYLRKSEKKLKIEQRKLSKKTKGSNNRNKQRIKVAKVHNKIKNQRNDFHHKVSSKIIAENQTICLEDLNVSGMIKNHKLAKSISDVGWSSFTSKLNYKALWYDKNIITINRFEPSTKLCSSCGVINDNLTLKDREWLCDCGVKHDRDINAAINIKKFGLIKLVRLERPNLKACGNETIVLSVKQEITIL